ncbi:YheC/YheD family protein [Heyndrickxia vini]|uniref:YheC/YheD family protein n=1 Tax=Heyndrickxia vini TaxID=1476025 RepID=A0ABX7E0K8_9BACI|nr:YheC/YheD family protein [Heyndrickxia vini]QQZ08322.1 YheC/YheD family protein [Heyndrickxia vini]
MISLIFIQPSFTLDEEFPVIEISNFLLKKFHLHDNGMITVQIGQKQIKAHCKVVTKEADSETIWLNQSCLNHFNLPSRTMKLQAFKHQNCLVLGPVVAIITEIKMSENKTPLFPSIQTFCQELHEYSENHGGLFFVTNISRFPTKGFYYQTSWEEDVTPTSNIIYNRIHSRQLEKKPNFQLLKNSWEQNGLLLFNDRYFSKWEIHEMLLSKKWLQSYLPSTIIFTEDNLQYWLKTYNDFYLKPDSGSQGRQIIHYCMNDNRFQLEQTSFSSKTLYTFETVDDAANQIRKWIRSKEFIMQQTIPLIHVDDRKIDFRFLCHKISTDRWTITSSVGRMSGEKSFVANIAQGGSIVRPEKIINTLFEKEKAKQILDLMRELAIEIATTISNETNGLIGELGIDIGVDLNGKPWLIEVNSKPSKQSDNDSPVIRPSAKAIFNYCTNLWIERSTLHDKTRDINDDTF